jgi:hypothetical protein
LGLTLAWKMNAFVPTLIMLCGSVFQFLVAFNSSTCHLTLPVYALRFSTVHPAAFSWSFTAWISTHRKCKYFTVLFSLLCCWSLIIIRLNGRMTVGEWWIDKFVEGSSHGLVKTSHAPQGTDKTHENRQGSQHPVQDLNWTLANTCQKPYHLSQLV